MAHTLGTLNPLMPSGLRPPPRATVPAGKALFLVTEDWYFCSHRLELARFLLQKGWNIHVACTVRDHGKKILEEGIRLHAIDFHRSSLSPWRVLTTLRQLRELIQAEQPDVLVAVALRPILLVPWIRPGRPVPTIHVVAGLGSLFSGHQTSGKGSWLGWLVHHLLGLALRGKNCRIVAQNRFDRAGLARRAGISPGQVSLIRGTGITDFPGPTRGFRKGREFRLLYVGRLLYDKGLGELMEAYRGLRQEESRIRLEVVGQEDRANPASVPPATLKKWQAIPGLQFSGRVAPGEIRNKMSRADCLVFPSYREGLPRVILEAGLTGLPVVATDIPGVREIIRHRTHGLLVAPRDSDSLAKGIRWMMHHPQVRKKMGQALAATVRKKFSVNLLSGQMERLMRSSLRKTKAAC